MTIEQRLERLERQNRWMKGAAVFAVVVAAAVLLVAQGKAKKLPDLEVRSLTVKSKSGKELAFLGIDDGWTAVLRFTSKDGRHRAMLGTSPDGLPYLYCGDNMGRALVSFGLGPWGLPGFGIRDKNGVNRLVLGIAPDGSVFLKLQDAKGDVIWQAPGKELLLPGKEDIASAKCKEYYDAVMVWKMYKKKFPDSLEDLEAPIRPGLGWFIIVDDDPWGNLYTLERDGSKVSIVSWGPDGKKGTADDIQFPAKE